MASIRPSLTSPSVQVHTGWLVVGAGIAAVAAASWAYLVYMAWGMANMDAVADSLLMPSMMNWDSADLLRVFIMWSIMMAAMMLPSAAPLLLLIARVNSGRFTRERAATATWIFGVGYLAVWIGFSLLATLAQWGLLEARLVSPMMDSASPLLSAALLGAAGAYQFTPLKHTCLARCRSPLGVIMTQWREGFAGAFVMGLRQGAFCTGCCWLLMALLLVFGVMNLVWIAALSILVLLEKLLRQPRGFSRATGIVLLGWGALAAGQAAFLAG